MGASVNDMPSHRPVRVAPSRRAGNYFNIGRGLGLILALLVALILGGNGLVIYQFKKLNSKPIVLPA